VQTKTTSARSTSGCFGRHDRVILTHFEPLESLTAMLVDPPEKTQPLQTHRFTSLKRVEQRASTDLRRLDVESEFDPVTVQRRGIPQS
jgi:hypothetical protein